MITLWTLLCVGLMDAVTFYTFHTLSHYSQYNAPASFFPDIETKQNDFIQNKIRKYGQWLLALTCLLIMFSVILSVLILKIFLAPLDKITHSLKILSSGSFDIPLPSLKNSELENTYRLLFSAIKNTENHCVELEKKISRRSTELEQIHAQLLQAGKLAAVGELSAGIAHELNNPIGGILGYSQFLLEKFQAAEARGEENSKQFVHYMEFITRESQRCKKIIQNLLKFSNSTPITKEQININVLLADTLDIVQHQIKLEEIDFITKYYPGLPMILADAHQLQQVFLNILINAIKSIPKNSEGEIIVTSSLKTKNNASFIEIRISDNGCGIPPEYHEKIFYPFFTTRQPGEGTGLGLSLSYGIIQEHGGKLTFETETGKGTTFIITLPGAPA